MDWIRSLRCIRAFLQHSLHAESESELFVSLCSAFDQASFITNISHKEQLKATPTPTLPSSLFPTSASFAAMASNAEEEAIIHKRYLTQTTSISVNLLPPFKALVKR